MTTSPTALSRALSVLAAFDGVAPYRTLSQICDHTGLPATSVHRYLAELTRWGAVERVGRGRYAIGTRLWQLGALAPRERSLRDAALPTLERLFIATHQVVHLVVVDHEEGLYVEKLAPTRHGTVASQVGKRLPLHATGPGKVLLAFGPPEIRDAVFTSSLARFASGTITDPARLRRELHQIRQHGYAVSREETTDGNASAAAPIFGADGHAAAAVSVVVPASTLNLAGLGRMVRAAGATITDELRSAG